MVVPPAGSVEDESGPPADSVALRSETDASLVVRARRGESRAFEILVRRHLKAAHAVALSKLGDSHDAEDACQEAFITALTRIDQCEHPDRFRGWLLTIVRNRAHNLRDYRTVRSAVSLEKAGPVAGAADPERDTERAELRSRLAEALDSLTELQRRVVMLHDYEGWTHKEIGKELGASAGASRFNLHAARRKLRKLLSGPEGEHE